MCYKELKDKWDDNTSKILDGLKKSTKNILSANHDEFLAEFASDVAKYQYKATTTRDEDQRRVYLENLEYLQANLSTRIAVAQIAVLDEAAETFKSVLMLVLDIVITGVKMLVA